MSSSGVRHDHRCFPQQSKRIGPSRRSSTRLHAAALIVRRDDADRRDLLHYVKRDDVVGTMYESHFRWQIRTFWFVLLWCAIAWSLCRSSSASSSGARPHLVHLPHRDRLAAPDRRQAHVRGLRCRTAGSYIRVDYVECRARCASGTHQPWIWLKIRNGMRTRGQRPIGQALRIEHQQLAATFQRPLRDCRSDSRRPRARAPSAARSSIPAGPTSAPPK